MIKWLKKKTEVETEIKTKKKKNKDMKNRAKLHCKHSFLTVRLKNRSSKQFYDQKDSACHTHLIIIIVSRLV